MKEIRCDMCGQTAMKECDGRYRYTITLREYRYCLKDSNSGRFYQYQKDVCDKCFADMFKGKTKTWERNDWENNPKMERNVYNKNPRLDIFGDETPFQSLPKASVAQDSKESSCSKRGSK